MEILAGLGPVVFSQLGFHVKNLGVPCAIAFISFIVVDVGIAWLSIVELILSVVGKDEFNPGVWLIGLHCCGCHPFSPQQVVSKLLVKFLY